MRELKFRAWHKKNKCWYGAGDPYSLTFYGFSIFGECTLLCTPGIEDLEHLEITQYTGLKDKNGKEIYEGDVLENTFRGDAGEIYFGDGGEGEPADYVGEYVGWCYGRGETTGITRQAARALKIIGNIYENPDLLK